MNPDYKALDLKCGLECHQQLEGKKLFCSCPTLNLDKPNFTFTRKLRAVAGETGEVDVAAAHEMQKDLDIVYVAHSDDTCLVECDEEPPHELNAEALNTALQIALLLHAKVVDEVHVMRKTVVDGSNVSGFQRTALIATEGFIETSLGKVGIPTICLEEEAAQKIDEGKGKITYKLDRLGIPLIEIATDASIKSPEHAKEVASMLGMILRSTENVKRGLGTIRQDVNISIKGGARTEVKGFQELKSIPKVIEFEVQRQLEEIKKGKKIEKTVRKAEPDFTTSYLRPMPGAARMYPETDILPIKIKESMLKTIKLPELLSDKAVALINKYKISDSHAAEILKEKIDFESYCKTFTKLDPQTIAKLLIEVPKDLKSRLKLDVEKLKKKDFEEVLGYMNKTGLSKEAITEIIEKKIKGEAIDLKQFEGLSDDQLDKEIVLLLKEKPNLSEGAYMGLLMAKHRGKVDGKKLTELLKKHLG